MTGKRFFARNIGILVFVWFFFSGLAALIYQVLWARQLELLFGSTLYAISTILSVFMAGLAIGSYFLGRLVDRTQNPLRLYAILEGIIGLYAFLTPLFFWLIPKVLVALKGIVPAGSTQFSPVYFIFSFLILIIPTTLMGGTLPILSKCVVSSQTQIGRRIGNLYFINTLGAAFGTIMAGFVLIFLLGTQLTTVTAAVINLAVAASAFLAARTMRRIPAQEPEVPGREPAANSHRREPVERGQKSRPRHANIAANSTPRGLSSRADVIILVGYVMAGFAALALEVQWTKVLTMMIGTSVYAFSLMLCAFLNGIALGSFFMAKLVDRRKDLWRDFAVIEILLGLSVLVMNPILGSLPGLFFKVFQHYRDIFWLLQTVEFSLIFLIMLVPTLLMGAAFPVASKLYAHELDKLGKRVGQIYASNTVGSILGPLAVSFLVIPLVGLQKSILLTAVIYVMIGAVVLSYSSSIRVLMKSLVLALLGAVFLFAGIFAPRWNKMVLSSGVYYHTSGSLLNTEESDYSLVYYKEGQMAVVTVIRGTDNSRALLINGKADASTESDLGTQLLLGHVPMLLHPEPKKVFQVGLGSGITLGAILQHPGVERVDVAELEPAVTEAARTFSAFNNDAMSNPKVRVFTTDARNYILTTDEKYDAITAEPSNPWVKGSSTIFSREVFETYRSRLNEDGIVVQWLHIYRLRSEDLKTMINTFRTVFPHTMLYGQFDSTDLLMVGSLKPLKLDLEKLQAKLQDNNVKASLSRIKADDLNTLLSYVLMDEPALARYAGDAPVNTDNRPIIEYSAPKSMYLNSIGSNWDSMTRFRTSALSLLPGLQGTPTGERIQRDFEAREKYIQAMIYFEEEQEQGDSLYKPNPLWKAESGNSQPKWLKSQSLMAREEAWNLSPTNGSTRQGLAASYEEAGEQFVALSNRRQNYYPEALEQYQLAIKVMPDKSSVWLKLGDLAYAMGESAERTIPLYEKALKLDERNPLILYKIARIYTEQENYSKSLEYLDRALEAVPDYGPAFIGRGWVYSQLSRYGEAIENYNRALSLDHPKIRIQAYLLRGQAYHGFGRYGESVKDYTRAIRIKPTAEAYDLRATSYISLKKFTDALKDADRALALEDKFDLAYYHRGQALAALGRKSEAIRSYDKYLALTQDGPTREAALVELNRLKTR